MAPTRGRSMNRVPEKATDGRGLVASPSARSLLNARRQGPAYLLPCPWTLQMRHSRKTEHERASTLPLARQTTRRRPDTAVRQRLVAHSASPPPTRHQSHYTSTHRQHTPRTNPCWTRRCLRQGSTRQRLKCACARTSRPPRHATHGSFGMERYLHSRE